MPDILSEIDLDKQLDDKPIVPMEVEQRLGSMPVMPESQPLKVPEQTKKPGFFASLGHSAMETNDIVNVATGISHALSHTNEDAPTNWSSVEGKQDLFLSVRPKYWGTLASATGPQDQQRLLEAVRGFEKEDDFYSNGSMAASLLGGLTGAVTSPSSWIPFSAAVKYAKVGKNVIANTLKVAPSLALSSLAHETALQIGTDTDDVSQLAFNTAIDTVYGSAFVAGTAGLSSAFRSYNLNNAKATVNMGNEGLTAEANISKDGVFQGTYKVVPAQGHNVSAAVVDKWQDVVDNTLVKSGMFALPIIGKYFTLRNPVVRGLTHPVKAVRLWTNKIASHSLNVEGIKKGLAQGANAEELIQDLRDSSKMLDVQLKGFWMEANGIEGGNQLTDAIAKQFKQRMEKEGFLSRADFNHEVQTVVISETQSANKSINSAAELVRNHIDHTWDAFRSAFDMPENYLPPATARAYLMKNYNMDAISQNPIQFHNVISQELLKQDTLIHDLTRPVITAKEILSELKDVKKSTKVDQKLFAGKIEAQRLKVKRLESELESKLRDDSDLAILLEKRNRLTNHDVEKVQALEQPLKNIRKEMGAAKKEIAAIKKKIGNSERSIVKAKTVKTKEVHLAKIKDLKVLLKNLTNSSSKIEEKLDEELSRVSGMAQDGKLNSRYFKRDPDTGFISLVDVAEDAPKLRAPFESDDARLAAAKSWESTITGFTAEQVNQSILAHMVPHIGSSPLKARTLMIPDEALHNAGFLSNELSKNIAVYDLVLGKQTIMKNLFPEFGNEDPIEGMSRLIVEEREINRAKILTPNTDIIDARISELRKQITELSKGAGQDSIKEDFDLLTNLIREQEELKAKNIADFDVSSDEVKKKLGQVDIEAKKAKEFVKNTYDILMGRTNASLTTRRMTSILKNFTITTLLGAVPLTQVGDLGGLVLKGGLWNFVRDGAFPLLRSAASGMKGKFATEWKKDAGHAQLAVEHLLHGHMDKLSNPNSVEYITGMGRTESAFKKMAEVSGNLFGTTYVDNQLQRMSAHMTQSKVMDFMFRFEKGTLKQKDLDTLLRSGIDPKKWAKPFIRNFKNSGGEKTPLGGFDSRWYDWADDETKNVMSTAIKRTLRETILKRGLFDNPFFTNSPIMNTFLLFKGWVFSATARYTLPLMQRANAQDAISILFMLGAGSLVDPMRRLARGESPEYNSDGAFLSALSNSGVLGYIFDAAETANAFSGKALGKTFLGDSFYKGSDRYQQRSIQGLLAGPVGSVADSIQKVLSAFMNGEMTENDAKKAIKMIPFTQAWYLRWITNKISEGLGLPKTKAEAREHSTALQGLYS